MGWFREISADRPPSPGPPHLHINCVNFNVYVGVRKENINNVLLSYLVAIEVSKESILAVQIRGYPHYNFTVDFASYIYSVTDLNRLTLYTYEKERGGGGEGSK